MTVLVVLLGVVLLGVVLLGVVLLGGVLLGGVLLLSRVTSYTKHRVAAEDQSRPLARKTQL